MTRATEGLSESERETLPPAQVVAMEYEGYLPSDSLDPAWIAGWHAAINHSVSRLAARAAQPDPLRAGLTELLRAPTWVGVPGRAGPVTADNAAAVQINWPRLRALLADGDQ